MHRTDTQVLAGRAAMLDHVAEVNAGAGAAGDAEGLG
jgi:hypothetical protein